MDAEIEAKINQCGQVAYTTTAGFYHTYEMAKYCIENNIKGDFVEMGVAAGTQIGVMGIVCQELEDERTIWGFDSFEGIPMACEKDNVQPALPDMKTPTEPVKDKSTLLVSLSVF